MSRCPLSISPSIGTPGRLFAAELLLQPRNIDDVPMFGELAVLDAPNIDGPERKTSSGRGDALQRLCVRRGESSACDDLVAGDDPVLDPHLEVRHAGKNPAKILDLSGEAARAAARVLDIGLGMDLREGAGIVGVHRRHIFIENRGADGPCTAVYPTVLRRESSVQRREKCAPAEHSETKHVASGGHVSSPWTFIPNITRYQASMSMGRLLVAADTA